MLRIGRDAFRQVEHYLLALRRPQRRPVPADGALIGGQQAAYDFEQRRLAGPVRSDQAHNLAAAHAERHALEREQVSEAERDVTDAQHARAPRSYDSTAACASSTRRSQRSAFRPPPPLAS